MLAVFEARTISKSFGPVKALSGVMVEIRAGEGLAILGGAAPASRC